MSPESDRPSMSRGTVLIMEDDREVSSLITELLKEEGFKVHVADTIFCARRLMRQALPTLMILDRKLPDGDGLEFCAEIRKTPQWSKVAILVLTAMGRTAEKIAGLRTGCDDYLAKPFSSLELLARVEALLRRLGALSKPSFLKAGGLTIEFEARRVFLNEEEISLGQKEFELLLCLIQHKNRVLTREFLLQQVWDYGLDNLPQTKAVDVMIGELRSKLGDFGARIVTVRGVGYRLDLDVEVDTHETFLPSA